MNNKLCHKSQTQGPDNSIHPRELECPIESEAQKPAHINISIDILLQEDEIRDVTLTSHRRSSLLSIQADEMYEELLNTQDIEGAGSM